jgi:hypothetical protein
MGTWRRIVSTVIGCTISNAGHRVTILIVYKPIKIYEKNTRSSKNERVKNLELAPRGKLGGQTFKQVQLLQKSEKCRIGERS